MSKDPFAEIEIVETGSAQQGQKIAPILRDPIRDKFYDMRSLAPNNPDDWKSAKLFYRQGKFMENFADDYEKQAPLSMFSPSYQRLGYEQLRTYFTWRTKVRQGEITKTSLSYVLLYVGEIINGIGVQNPAQGLSILVNLWGEIKQHTTHLDDFMATILKDYHVHYDLPHSFKDFILAHNLYYPEVLMFCTDSMLENWFAISEYGAEKQDFCSANQAEIFDIIFPAVIDAIAASYKNIGGSFLDLFYVKTADVPWQPFSDSIFFSTLIQPNRNVSISNTERYICENNKWMKLSHVYHKHYTGTMKFIIYHTINAVYKLEKSRVKIKIPLGLGKGKAIIDGTVINVDKLQGIIYDAVNKAYSEYMREKNRVVVNVDAENISRIREESEEIQERLIVEDEWALARESQAPNNCDEIAKLTMESSELRLGTDGLVDCFALRTANVLHPDSPAMTDEDGVTDGKPSLKLALTAVELAAIKIIITNPDGIHAFARENNIMLEILADGINEKAMDIIGDNILEVSDTITVYDDYLFEFESL